VRWRWAGLVPLAGASTSYQLLGGLLYTMDGNANRRTATAWSTDPPRRLWSVSTELQLDPSGSVIRDGGSTMVLAGAYTLQQSATSTTVIDPRSGRIRWSSPVPVLAHSGGTGIVPETTFPAGTEYDQSSGDPGPLYWSADGVPYTQPPDRTVLHGLDLATGRERWTVTQRGSVYVVPAGGDATGFVVVAAGRLALLAADTGAVVRERALPRFAGTDVSYPEIVGDLLILRHDVVRTGAGTATAFGLDTFEQRWQVREPGDTGDHSFCIGLPCEREPGGLAVLDARSGVTRWHARPNVNLIARWSDVLEVQGDRPLRLLDLRTGKIKVDLAGWDTVTDAAGAAPIMVFRAEPGSGRAGFGVLWPGARRVLPLGLSSAPVQRCSADDRFVACRVDGGIEMWSYRA